MHCNNSSRVLGHDPSSKNIPKLDQGFSFTYRSSAALADFVPDLGSKVYASDSTLLLLKNVKFVY